MANKKWLQTGADGLTFGERLEDLYRSKGITQSQLANETGIKQSAISEYINGKNGGTVPRSPDCATVVALSKYFSVSTDYLLGLTTTKTTNENVRSVCNITGLSEENVIRLIDWQVGEHKYHLHGVADICIESAYRSLWDYIRIDEARMRLDQHKATETEQKHTHWESVLAEIKTGDQANEYGYTMLKHKDAISFYARSIANQLERYLEAAYSNDHN